MDTFGEQLVKKATTGADWAKRIGIAVLGLALATVLMWLSFFTGFMILTIAFPRKNPYSPVIFLFYGR